MVPLPTASRDHCQPIHPRLPGTRSSRTTTTATRNGILVQQTPIRRGSRTPGLQSYVTRRQEGSMPTIDRQIRALMRKKATSIAQYRFSYCTETKDLEGVSSPSTTEYDPGISIQDTRLLRTSYQKSKVRYASVQHGWLHCPFPASRTMDCHNILILC